MITSLQIRAARAMLGIKQSELAKAAGISLATLNNIERDVGDPRASTLVAIADALERGGVSFSDNNLTESVMLSRMARPAAGDTFFASQGVLELLGPASLTKVAKVLFFSCRVAAGNAAGDWPGDRHRVCLLIEGTSRAILFDRADFSLGNAGRVAEVAGILLAAFVFHPSRLYYLDAVLENTLEAELGEMVHRLRGLPWQRLSHPKVFFDVFDDWDGRLLRYADRRGHPMADLVALVSAVAPA